METILLLGIGVYMMTRILAQVIEDLYVLLLAFALVGVLFRIRFLGLRAIFGKV